VSRVIDAADPAAPVVELTVSAKVNPSDAAAVKQRVLDHESALLAAA
jgi:small conductance mechanosensitive channel